MSRKIVWTSAKYKIALLGDVLPGLRSVAKGFEAADGYDLRNIASWTKSRKKRVQDYYARMHLLYAQERVIVRPRNKRKLTELQTAFHGDVPSKMFKVAFVPFTQSIGVAPTVPKIKLLKSGIEIKGEGFTKYFIPFNKQNLLKNTESEIKRVLDAMPGVNLFYVAVNEFQTLNGEYADALAKRVTRYMHKYDGVKALPRTSGNYGDDPKAHHWKNWLNGVIGFRAPDTMEIAQKIYNGMQAAKARRAMQDKRMKSVKKQKRK